MRHQPNGRRIPWLDARANQELTRIAGSVLALHVPHQDASGPGNLVLDQHHEAAFITDSGVSWEIGPIVHAIDEVHKGPDHTVQIFLTSPIGLHLTLNEESARNLFNELGWDPLVDVSVPVSNQGKENSMGIFKKDGAGSGPKISFPAGEEPPSGTDTESHLVAHALAKTSQSTMPMEDVMSYGEASYANVLGIPEQDLIIAWGPARIRTPIDDRDWEGTVVLTRNCMLAYWQPGRTSLIHTFQGNHSGINGVETTDPNLLLVSWEVGELANNEGKFLVGDAVLSLAPVFGKDPHANRRALTWFYTLRSVITD
jgi:hypothetical protein